MFLLDTNIISMGTYPLKDKRRHKVSDWLRQNTPDCYVSIFSIGEMYKGIENQKKAESFEPQSQTSAQMIRKRTDEFVRYMQSVNRVVYPSVVTMRVWAVLINNYLNNTRAFQHLRSTRKRDRVKGATKRDNISSDVLDTLIAATAISSELTLVTTNESDFQALEHLLDRDQYDFRILNPLN